MCSSVLRNINGSRANTGTSLKPYPCQASDTRVALRCARLHVPDLRSDRDALIAATALVYGMTVVTRNMADFEPTGVPLLNPWDALMIDKHKAK